MKIAMFWDYDPNQEVNWDTPTGIYKNLNKDNEVRRYPLPSFDKTLGFKIFLSDNFKPDFCFLMNAGSLREGTVYWNKKILFGVPLVLEAGDEPQAYSSHEILSKNSDLILSPDIRCVKAYGEKGINSKWWTHWCDESIFYKDETKPENKVVSSMYGYRPITSNVNFLNKTGLRNKENGDWLRSGKIILQESRWGEITRRIFEGMGCGRMVLTNKIEEETGIFRLFEDKKDIVYYSSKEECESLIEYYLRNEEERESIALSGYNKIINNHTSAVRTFFLLNEVQKLLVK